MTASYIERRIVSIVEDRLAAAPVVVLQGARSVGKSTVLAELARRHDVEITDLEMWSSAHVSQRRQRTLCPEVR